MTARRGRTKNSIFVLVAAFAGESDEGSGDTTLFEPDGVFAPEEDEPGAGRDGPGSLEALSLNISAVCAAVGLAARTPPWWHSPPARSKNQRGSVPFTVNLTTGRPEASTSILSSTVNTPLSKPPLEVQGFSKLD